MTPAVIAIDPAMATAKPATRIAVRPGFAAAHSADRTERVASVALAVIGLLLRVSAQIDVRKSVARPAEHEQQAARGPCQVNRRASSESSDRALVARADDQEVD